MMDKILAVTGATGKKSGGVFAQQLSKENEKMKEMFPGGLNLIVRDTTDTTMLKKLLPQGRVFAGNITNSEFLEVALKNVDTLVHIAGIGFSTKIVDAAVSCGVRRLILVHTTGIYSKYKAAGESYRKIEEYIYKICEENKIILTICRPTMIYGNISDNNIVKFIKMVDKLPMMPIVNGAYYELQPVHYTDLGKAYFNILIHEGKTANRDFILSGGEPIMLRDMLELIGKHLNKKIHFINCPFWIAYFCSVLLYYCSFRKVDYREKVQRLCEPRVYSFEEAATAFNYSPMTFAEGIENEIKEYLANKNI